MSDYETWDAAYVLGALEPEDVATYEKHLRTCAECRARVAELTPLRDLLAHVPADRAEPAEPVPATLLPALLNTVRRKRNRRRATWIGGVAALAACVALVLVLALPAGSDGTPMTPVAATQLHATIGLSTVDWGTKISVHCSYASNSYAEGRYRLSVTDRQGNTSDAGSWRVPPGVDAKMDAATSVPKDQIAEVRVLTASGVPLLQTRL